MKRILAFVVVIALLPVWVVAESPSIIWEKSFNFGGNNDQPASVFIDRLGNLIVNGLREKSIITDSPGVSPAICKLSSSGNVIWTRVDTTKDAGSGLSHIASLPNQKVFLTITDWKNNAHYILGHDANGNLLWKNPIQNNATLTVYGDTLVAVIEGSNTQCAFMDDNGDLFRTFSLGTTLGTTNPSIHNNFLYTTGYDGAGWVLVKVSLETGKLIWNKKFPDMAFNRCTVGKDGDLFVAGSVIVPTSTPNGQIYLLAHFVARLNPDDGSILWQRQWFSRETNETNYENGTYAVAVSAKKNIVVVGGAIQKGNVHNGNKTAFLKAFDISTGETKWGMIWDYPEAIFMSYIISLAFDQNDELVALGNSYSSAGGSPPNVIHIQKYHIDGVLDVQERNLNPSDFRLEQNYPNPFNPSTTIEFQLPERATVKITVYNMLGQEVGVVADGEFQAGVHQANWNATNMPSGAYVYRINAGKYSAVKRMLLVK